MTEKQDTASGNEPLEQTGDGNRKVDALVGCIHSSIADFDRKAYELSKMASAAKEPLEYSRLMTKAGCYRACANDLRFAFKEASNVTCDLRGE